MLITGRHFVNYNGIRSGVIPYTFFGNKIYFLLAIDANQREYTDFGGGCKMNETLIDAGFREFHEESCCMFASDITREDLLNSISISNHDRTRGIFFVYIEPYWMQKAKPTFSLCRSNSFKDCEKENSDVVWVDLFEFEMICYSEEITGMWYDLKSFIQNNCNFERLIDALNKKQELLMES